MGNAEQKQPSGAQLLSTLIRLYADQHGLKVDFEIIHDEKGETPKCEKTLHPAC